MPYLLLAIAIVSEVLATTALKQSDGFSRVGWSAATVAGYAVSFSFLSLTLRTMPTGTAYAIWSGVGIVLVSLLAWLVNGQKLDGAAVLGMALIIAGVATINLFSRTAAH